MASLCFKILDPDVHTSIDVPIQDRELFPKSDPKSYEVLDPFYLNTFYPCLTSSFHDGSQRYLVVVPSGFWELDQHSIDFPVFVKRLQLVNEWVSVVCRSKHMLKISRKLIAIFFDYSKRLIISISEWFFQFGVLSEGNHPQFVLQLEDLILQI